VELIRDLVFGGQKRWDIAVWYRVGCFSAVCLVASILNNCILKFRMIGTGTTGEHCTRYFVQWGENKVIVLLAEFSKLLRGTDGRFILCNGLAAAA
jgi:hypothetical protein